MNEKQLFFDTLKKYSSGERAILRRCCGKLLKDAEGQAVVLFYRCLPRKISSGEEDKWFAAACFSCLWDAENVGEPIEEIFARIKEDSGSMEHRLASLLDLEWEADGYFLIKLCRIIKMAKSKGMTVDCMSLLNDLIYWNSSVHSVQRKWARAMYIKNSIV